jgi:hypothetical protein
MKRPGLAAILVTLCCWLHGSAGAAPGDEGKLARLQSLSAQVQGQAAASPEQGGLSEPGRKALEAALVRNIEGNAAHDQWKRGFIESSWIWHLWSTGLLFFLVVGIVCFGLYMTYVQFNRDYSAWSPPPQAGKPVLATGDEAADAAAGALRLAPALHTVKINAGGLELTSQVVGLLVLAFSLAFFYFYVHRVYPMQTEELTQLRDKEADNKTGHGGAPGKAPAGTAGP